MNIILKENETMQDLVERLAASFELVYDIAPVAYWYENLHENGRIKDIHFSKRMRDMLGYKSLEEFPDELNTLMTFTHPDDVHIMLDDAIRAGTGEIDKYDVQYRIRKADGSYMWCNATGELVKDCNGTTVGMYGAFVDVSKEVELIEKQESERETRQVIKGFSEEYDAAFYGRISDDAYQTLTNVGVVASKTEQFASFEDAMKSYVRYFVHPDDVHLFDGEFVDIAVLKNSIPVGGSKTFEYRSRSSGKYEWFRAMLRHITEDEVLVGFKNYGKEHMFKEINDKLLEEFDAIYIVDLDRRKVLPARTSRTAKVGDFEGENDYLPLVMALSEIVDPQYKQDWINFGDTAFVKRYMANDDHREYVYELPGAEKAMRRFSIDVLERKNGEASVALYSFVGIDEGRASSIRLHRQLAEQQQKMVESGRIISALSEDFGCVLYVELKDSEENDIGINYRVSELLKKIIPGWEKETGFAKKLKLLLDYAIYEPDKEQVIIDTKRETILEKLKSDDVYYVDFRLVVEDVIKYYQMKFSAVRENGELVGVVAGLHSVDEQMREQQKHLLGAVPISPDILAKEGIGMWAFELDEGQPPRMYGDKAMLELVGLEHQVPPEEMYHAWYDHIDEGSYKLVQDVVDKMISGENAEVQYPWHHPDGYTMIVRCGGVRNLEYSKGIRVEGTHQDVTEVLHFDDKERKALAETNARLFALEDNFESMYDVNLETGEYEEFIKGQTFSEKVSTHFVEHGEFFETSYQNIDAVVFPEDKEEFKRAINPDNIRMELEANSHFDYYYRLVVDGEPVWFRMRVVYKEREKKNIIIGVFNASKDIEAKQIAEQKAQLESQQNQIRESLTFTNFFLDTYISAYYVNLKDLTYQVYKRPAEQDVRYPFTANYYDSLKAYVDLDVHPDERAALKEILVPEKLRTVLKENDEYTYFYRSLSEGSEKIIRLQVIRGADEDHAAIGFIDVTEEMEEQQKRFLGAMPLSNDVLAKANIGMWAFELDEGQPPRMYDDETMLGLVGLDHQVPPEEAYHAWYDHIDEGSYDLVNDAVAKMMDGEHAEVQYPWHYPDGRTIMVRCGGVRNFEYTKGIRIEGTHQNVTQTLHFDEEERKRAKQTENDLIISKLRADSLAFIADNEPDLDNAINFFGKRILEISGCDQVIFREMSGHRIVLNAPGIEDIPQEICSQCPFVQFNRDEFGEDGVVLMNDCSEGYSGTMTHPDCPAKSSFMQQIYSGGELVGLFTIHYLNNKHTFTENGIEVLKTVALYLGLLIGRINEKKAEIARIEAESSNKAKTEFLFNMSHDIRTPMNAILGYTDIAIRHKESPEKVIEGLKKIKVAGGHLLNLINDILEMSRIEAGAMELTVEPLDIRQAIEGVKQMGMALAVPKDIDFQVVIKNMKNSYIYADELHVNQILINLISNAVKYTNPGGKVEYVAEQISESVDGIARFRFTIKDNGIGMSEEFQKHLFESFAREQTATVSKQEGAGLGLAIVKRITDMVGGTISAQSQKGIGSTFALEIPFQVMDDTAIEQFVYDQKSDAIPDEACLEGKKVLLVEDNEMNREIATEILEEAGLVIDTAEDGELAVEAISQKGIGYYDFVLMDIQMPVMNGYDATKVIRAKYPDARLPIIALSANAFEEDKAASVAAGMDDHVAKPINIGELFKVLTKYL